jgi:hypothetical protein
MRFLEKGAKTGKILATRSFQIFEYFVFGGGSFLAGTVTVSLELVEERANKKTGLALQRNNTENSKQIFPEKELRGRSPNFHIQGIMWTDPGNI